MRVWIKNSSVFIFCVSNSHAKKLNINFFIIKIQIFDVIKQGINLSFKDKTVLSLIILYSIFLWSIPDILTNLFAIIIKPEDFIIPEDLIDVLLFVVFIVFIIFSYIFSYIVIKIVFLYAIAKAVFENLNKRDISISNAITSALKKSITIFVATIIYFLIVSMGWLSLVIPGIFLLVALSFYGHAILLNNKGIITSFKESYNIVEGNWWRAFAIGLIFLIVFVLTAYFALLIEISVFISQHFLETIHTLIDLFVSGIAMVIYTIVYFQLIEKEKKREEKIKSAEVVQEKR